MDMADRLNGYLNGHARPPATCKPPCDPEAPLRPQIVRLCVRAIAASEGRIDGAVRIVIRHGASRVVYDVTPEGVRAALGPRPVEGLSPVAAAISRVLTDAPQTAKALARMAGYHINPHFRGGLRELQRHVPPLCVRTPEGYRLAGEEG